MASYDKMDWHYSGDYPDELPTENSGTHIGMYLAWIINNGLQGDMFRQESSGVNSKSHKTRVDWTRFSYQ
jgi:hypothetical protein